MAGAAQVLLEVSLELPAAGNYSDGFEWAREHEGALYWAFARTLNVHPAELRMDLLGAEGPGRRLLAGTAMAFSVRLTMLLEVNASTTALERAAQELAVLPTAPKMSVFQAALFDELYPSEAAGNLTNFTAASSMINVAIIDDYVLPEPAWWVDCDCADGVAEVGEIVCSRGLWLACTGPAELRAGPMPSTSGSCACGAALPAPEDSVLGPSLAVPVWLLAAAGIGGCGCCMLLGVFLASRCLRCFFRALPAEPFSGKRTLKGMGDGDIEASYTVQPALRPEKSRRRTVDFGDAEPGFLRRLSTLRVGTMATDAKSEEAVSQSKTAKSAKTHVVWDLDMTKVTTMFVKKTSTDQREADGSPSRARRSGLRGASSPKSNASSAMLQVSFPADGHDVEDQAASPSSRVSRERSGTLLDRYEFGPTDTDITMECSKL